MLNYYFYLNPYSTQNIVLYRSIVIRDEHTLSNVCSLYLILTKIRMSTNSVKTPKYKFLPKLLWEHLCVCRQTDRQTKTTKLTAAFHNCSANALSLWVAAFITQCLRFSLLRVFTVAPLCSQNLNLQSSISN